MIDETPATLAALAPSRRRWEAIADDLRSEIATGRFEPGQKLPNEIQLAQRFGVHRHTLRQALQALVREGLVTVRHGSGSYVRELVLDYALQRRTRLTENIAEAGERAVRELLSHQEELAGDWAAPLHLSRRARVCTMRMRVVVRGRPVGLCTSAFPLPRLAGIVQAFEREGGVTAALAALGVADYTRARSVVTAGLPSAAEAEALARPAEQPVLVVDYVNVDSAGLPIQAGRTVFAADAVQLTVGPDGWEGA